MSRFRNILPKSKPYRETPSTLSQLTIRRTKTLLERQVEQALVREVRKHGGIAPKFTSPGTAGMPDRLVILPEGKVCFVELKAPGQKPRPIQIRQMDRLTQLGCMVRTIDHPTQIQELNNEIRTA